jgi:iron complex transport system substrate-binding protein
MKQPSRCIPLRGPRPELSLGQALTSLPGYWERGLFGHVFYRAIARISFLFLLLFFFNAAYANISVYDDSGERIQLNKPAQRIISLAPNITELLFAVGAGDRIVGVSSGCDYPPQVKNIPVVGSHRSLDLETILTLRPDLIITWTGSTRRQLEKFKRLHLPVYLSSPKNLTDITKTFTNFGKLTGNETIAEQAAQTFSEHYDKLNKTYQQQPRIKVFYQIWQKPLFSVGHNSLISQLIELCGGDNIFDRVKNPSPEVNLEAVLAANPDAIIGGSHEPNWQNMWLRWPQLKAVQMHAIYSIDPELLQRFGPRILEGADRLCEDLERARKLNSSSLK